MTVEFYFRPSYYIKVLGVRKQVARLMTIRGTKPRWDPQFRALVNRYYELKSEGKSQLL